MPRFHQEQPSVRDSVRDLLKDPDPTSAGSLCASSSLEPSRRTARAHVKPPGRMTDILGGHSERNALGVHAGDCASLRQLEGCNVYTIADRVSSQTARKNESSGSDAGPQAAKGKAGVTGRSQQRSSGNPLYAPDSQDWTPAETTKRYTGRHFHQHNGDIIREPPSVDWPEKRTRGGPAQAPSLASRHGHGDIISGRNQHISTTTGRRRTEYGKAIQENGTLGILDWRESNSARKCPPASSRFEYNSSVQMQNAFNNNMRPKTAPTGYTSIEMLAMKTALMISAPRDHGAGSGLADLNR